MVGLIPSLILVGLGAAGEPPPDAEVPPPPSSPKELEMELGKQALHDNMIPIAIRHFQRAARLDPADATPRWILEYCETLIWDLRDAHSPPGYPYTPGGQYGWHRRANIRIEEGPGYEDIEDDGFVVPPPQPRAPTGPKATSGATETSAASDLDHARALLGEGRAEEALNLLQGLAKAETGNFRLDLYMGDAMSMIGRQRDALRYYEDFVRRAPIADPSIAPLVEAVQRRIETLRSSNGAAAVAVEVPASSERRFPPVRLGRRIRGASRRSSGNDTFVSIRPVVIDDVRFGD